MQAKCSRCTEPCEPVKVEMLASGTAKWCAKCWESESRIRRQVRTTGRPVRSASPDFEGDGR